MDPVGTLHGRFEEDEELRKKQQKSLLGFTEQAAASLSEMDGRRKLILRRSFVPRSLSFHFYLQAEGAALDVPPQTHSVPLAQGQAAGEAVSNPQQPGVQRPLVPLQAQLWLGGVSRAVGEGRPGSGDQHADVHADGHAGDLQYGGPFLQSPVVLAALQHGLDVPQEVTQPWGTRRSGVDPRRCARSRETKTGF